MRNNLIGYLLGSLDNAEHERLESELLQNPQLQSELEKCVKSLELLERDAQVHCPPDGLAEATCDHVQGFETRSVKATTGGKLRLQFGLCPR